ncbi:MAG: hypothetical protein PF904_17055 [Kiritimatiellae bacterium]|jgi:hypothetical protein|nr:hypothetical protein [Kiritimatiellia bacterium]
MEDYLDKSGKAILAACLTYDHARSAEKMADWNCIGENNIAWKQGPFLSAGANEKQLDRSKPYCFKISDEFAAVAEIIMGPNPEISKNGGVKLPLPPKDKNESRVEPVISKLAILEQFELFKEFLQTFNGPFNKKRCKAWENLAEKDKIDLVTELTDRRNELTHDSDYKMPSMKEAVEYFYELRQLAPLFYKVFQQQKNS